LDEVYKISLTRINDLELRIRKMVKGLIVWAVLSIRPLNLREISHTLAADFKRKKFNSVDVPEVDAILSLTQGLVVYQGESKRVRPVYEIVYEVLRNYASNLERFKPGGPHQYLASGCLTYLSFDDFESGFCQTSDEFEKRLQSNLLYDYAAHNWGHHARKVSTLSQALSQAVVDFLESEAKVDASSQGFLAIKRYWSFNYSQEVPRRISGLHLAAYFGVEAVVKLLLAKDGVNPDSKDNGRRTPLSYAAENGYEAVVKLLLAKDGVNPDSKDNRGTPLSWAVENGHEAVVKLLLEKGAEPEAMDEAVVMLLLKGRYKRHKAVLKLLLEY
jgi:hypothetical protein